MLESFISSVMQADTRTIEQTLTTMEKLVQRREGGKIGDKKEKREKEKKRKRRERRRELC